MGIKHMNAVTIEEELLFLLDYGESTEEKKRSIEDKISANFFEQDDTDEYLKSAIKKSLDKINIEDVYKNQIKELLIEVETLPFEKTAELWQIIVVLLKTHKMHEF